MQPTFVITANSLVPFAQEMPIILSLPIGCKFRSRFPIQWVHDNISSDIKLASNLLGVLVLRDWESAKLIPIRKIKIDKITLFDDLVFIEYFLLEYVSGLDDFESKFQDDITNFFESEGVQNIAKQPVSSLVFVADTDAAYQDANDIELTSLELFSRWNRIVRRLCLLACFNAHLFAKIDVVHRTKQSNVVVKNGELQLLDKQQYELQIFYSLFETPDSQTLSRHGLSRAPDSPYMEDGPYSLDITSGNGATIFSQQHRKLSGRYDLVRIPIVSNHVSNYKTDRVRIAYSHPAELNKSFDASIYLDIKYSQRIMLNVVAFCVAFFFYVLLSFSANLFTWMPSSAKLFVQQVSLILMVLQITFLVQWLRRT